MENKQNIRLNTKHALNTIIDDDFITTNVERGIYNYTIWKSKTRCIWSSWENNLFKDIYVSKVLQILSNISPSTYTNSPSILNRLKNREFLPHMIAFMKCTELSPENWEVIISEKKKIDDMMCEIDFGQATTQFRCGKCRNNKTTYYTMQTRSADEPETIFITCLVCGKKWRK